MSGHGLGYYRLWQAALAVVGVAIVAAVVLGLALLLGVGAARDRLAGTALISGAYVLVEWFLDVVADLDAQLDRDEPRLRRRRS